MEAFDRLARLAAWDEYEAHNLDHAKNAALEGLQALHHLALSTMDARTRARYRKQLGNLNWGFDRILDYVDEEKMK